MSNLITDEVLDAALAAGQTEYRRRYQLTHDPGVARLVDTAVESALGAAATANRRLHEALDALEAVLAPHQLHEVPGGQRWCLHCGADWPCPTVAAVTGALS